jgi:hypothetical protein
MLPIASFDPRACVCDSMCDSMGMLRGLNGNTQHRIGCLSAWKLLTWNASLARMRCTLACGRHHSRARSHPSVTSPPSNRRTDPTHPRLTSTTQSWRTLTPKDTAAESTLISLHHGHQVKLQAGGAPGGPVFPVLAAHHRGAARFQSYLACRYVFEIGCSTTDG